MPTLLTGLPLAHALYTHGLAPSSIFAYGAPPKCYFYHLGTLGLPWRPWDSLDAVAHLLERYGLEVWRTKSHWRVVKPGQEWELAVTFAELPAAIGRLSLLLHAAEQKEQNR